MTEFPYIQISFSTQQGDSVTNILNCSSAAVSEDWNSEGPNPRSIFNLFLNACECYVQWTTKSGNYFAVVFRDPYSNRDTYCMLTMLVDNGASLTGTQVYQILRHLRKKFVEEKQISEKSVLEVLNGLNIPVEPVKCDSWRIGESYIQNVDEMPCYRTYVSTQELESFFTFARQAEYDKYSFVIYVAATTSLRPGMKLAHITSPLANLYNVVANDDIIVSKTSASNGERIAITYNKKDYSPIHQIVTVGTPSYLVSYDGSTMRVKSAAEARLVFVRRIPVDVTSEKGGSVKGYTATVNGKPAVICNNSIEISQTDIERNHELTISISSTNFENKDITLKVDDLNSDGTLEVKLKPIEHGVTLRLDFGNNRVFEYKLSLEKNTPEYSQLHSGNFHGFRAHRLMLPGNDEVYNVDVKAPDKPVSPSFENIVPKAGGGKEELDLTPPVVDTDKPDMNGKKADYEYNPKNSRKSYTAIICCSVLLLLAIVIVACLYCYPTFNKPLDGDILSATDTVIAEEIVSKSEEVPVQVEETAKAEQTDSLSQSDIEYLNRSGVWELDSLQSSGGKSLFHAITDGDIRAMANNSYYTVESRATNEKALKLIDMLWSACNTPTEKSNSRCMTEEAKNGKVDLHQLYENVARYRSSEPNKQPRP